MHVGNVVILDQGMARRVRPAILGLVRQEFAREVADTFDLERLATAFGITPRDVGFAFDAWEALREARYRVCYPGYGEPTPDGGED